MDPWGTLKQTGKYHCAKELSLCEFKNLWNTLKSRRLTLPNTPTTSRILKVVFYFFFSKKFVLIKNKIYLVAFCVGELISCFQLLLTPRIKKRKPLIVLSKNDKFTIRTLYIVTILETWECQFRRQKIFLFIKLLTRNGNCLEMRTMLEK